MAVDFDVAAKPESRVEARHRAGTVARQQAELYPEASGVRPGAVSRIEDVDPEENERYRVHGWDGAASAEDRPRGRRSGGHPRFRDQPQRAVRRAAMR